VGKDKMKHFEIQPNCSMTWKQLMTVFYIMVAISLMIAGFFAVIGIWAVLPFAGLEMMILWFALYCVSRKGSKRELIDIQQGRFFLHVEQCGVQQDYQWYLPWVNVELQAMRFDVEKKRLIIRYKDERIEIANGLHEEEKNLLAIALRKAIATAV